MKPKFAELSPTEQDLLITALCADAARSLSVVDSHDVVVFTKALDNFMLHHNPKPTLRIAIIAFDYLRSSIAEHIFNDPETQIHTYDPTKLTQA